MMKDFPLLDAVLSRPTAPEGMDGDVTHVLSTLGVVGASYHSFEPAPLPGAATARQVPTPLQLVEPAMPPRLQQAASQPVPAPVYAQRLPQLTPQPRYLTPMHPSVPPAPQFPPAAMSASTRTAVPATSPAPGRGVSLSEVFRALAHPNDTARPAARSLRDVFRAGVAPR